MGTRYQIKAIPNASTSIAESALQIQVDKTLESFNQVMSTYIIDSELSLLNKAEIDEWQIVSSWLFDILAMSQQVSTETLGAFDITVGPLVNLWGFGPEEQQDLPSDIEIEDALKNIGYQNLVLDEANRQAKKLADIYLDLSAVAKGYATDVVATQLQELGFTDYMVEIGGELYVSGHNPKGNAWRIGVENPTLVQTGAMQAVAVSNVGVATSGDYRNYMEVEGKRISHTIDPTTGRPITHNLASITVIAKSGGLADAYATALNVLGPDKGYTLAKKKGLAAYFVIREADGYGVKYTKAFEKYLSPAQ